MNESIATSFLSDRLINGQALPLGLSLKKEFLSGRPERILDVPNALNALAKFV